MRIPSVDLPAQGEGLRRQLHEALDRVIQRGDGVLGEAVQQFETLFARACGVAYGIGVNSGTDALWAALLSVGVERDDEVITTAYTFFATASAIALTGARPVPVDIDPRTYNLDPDRIEAAITKRTTAMLVVHLFGQPADMDRLCRIAHRHKLAVIEDCAQAHGARFGGRSVGSFGDAGAFSFYPTKNLGALGDGGMVVTNRRMIRDRVRLLRDHGRADKYRHTIIGRNSRLDTLQAGILLVKLQHLARWNRLRARHAARYTRLFSQAGHSTITPITAPHRRHSYHLYVVRVPARQRDHVIRALNADGIQALVHYPIPFYLQPAFRSLGYRRGSFPLAEQLAREAISLPLYPEMTARQIERVANRLIEAVER